MRYTVSMTASILSGTEVAETIKKNLRLQSSQYLAQYQRLPGLAVIMVGEDPASQIYVNHKQKACREVGIYSECHVLPKHTSEESLLSLITKLNHAENIDGILVQLPLPPHIQTQAVIEQINHSKDVDGFHPYNLGRLAQGKPTLRPCTPYGIIQLLNHYNIPIYGKNAVIIGASNIVGRPMALEFLLAKATVTVCHSATHDLNSFIHAADIIVVATGKKDIINTNHLQKHQIVIDVGIHRLPNHQLRGDVDFQSACTKVQWITPVPGGVGPMTICGLLQNTLIAATQTQKILKNIE